MSLVCFTLSFSMSLCLSLCLSVCLSVSLSLSVLSADFHYLTPFRNVPTAIKTQKCIKVVISLFLAFNI